MFDVFGKLPKADGYLKDGDTLKFSDNYEIKCLETPGHTPEDYASYR